MKDDSILEFDLKNQAKMESLKNCIFKKIQLALEGNFDQLIEPLTESVKKFDKENFKKSFLSF